MISNLRKFLAKAALALCLASGITAQTLEPAEAAPLSIMRPALSDQTPDLVQPAQYYRHYRHVRRYRVYRHRYHYGPRYRYRPVYRPIYRPHCRRFVGWHMTRFGMMYGAFNRCYR